MTAAWITAAAGAILALVYQAWLNRPESALRSGLKTAPLALFALAALLAGAPWGLALGLGLGALGDYALSRRGDAMFQLGLGSFALAHVAYAIVFVGIEGRLPLLDLNAARWLGLAALVVMAHSTVVWLLPFARGMQRPVAAYVAIITLMGLSPSNGGRPVRRK